MIRIDIRSPVPELLGLSDSLASVKTEVDYLDGMTMGDVIDSLKAMYPRFSRRLARTPDLLGKCVLTIGDEAVIASGPLDEPVPDGSTVKILSPYFGG
jgi:molybdopterin converting factor small subunit